MPPTQASGRVAMEANCAVEAIVIGSDQLETQFYSVLCAAFARQIVGDEEFKKAEEEFRQARKLI